VVEFDLNYNRELLARTDAARAELNEMRIRAKEYDSLVKAYAMLTDLSNN
jgi:hypothetical protein